MASEVNFAKSFLSSLDSRPTKLQSDYATDPKTFVPSGPYTLPKMPNPMSRPDQPAAPGSAPAVTVSLKSLKNPPLDLSLPAQPLTTSVLELKQKLASNLGLSNTDKIRLLYSKKPALDSKSIKDVIGDTKSTTVEFSVMVMGGVPAKDTLNKGASGSDTTMQDAPVAQGESGEAVLEHEEFWSDLQGFLEQRVRDSAVAERAAKIFAEAWKEKGSLP